MIYRMANAIGALLQTRGYPVAVEYGPEVTMRELRGSPVIVFERDRDGGDTVGPPVASPSSPVTKRMSHVRGAGVLVHVYASSAIANARVNEHEALCDQLVDALLVELHRWRAREYAGHIAIVESRMLTSDEVDGSPLPTAGAVYRLRFLLPRAVFDLDYSGDGRDTATLDDVTSTMTVSLDGETDEDVT